MPTKVTCVPTAWFLVLFLPLLLLLHLFLFILALLILPSPPLATLLVFLAALNHVCIQFSCFLEDTAARLFQSFKWLIWKNLCYRDSVSYNEWIIWYFFFLNFESSIWRFTRCLMCNIWYWYMIIVPDDYSNHYFVLWRKWEMKFFFCSDSFSIKSSLEVGSRVHVHLASYQLKEDYKTGQRAVLQTKISWIKAEHSFFPPPNFLFFGISFLKKMEFEGNIASKITMQAFRLEVSPVHVYSMKF